MSSICRSWNVSSTQSRPYGEADQACASGLNIIINISATLLNIILQQIWFCILKNREEVPGSNISLHIYVFSLFCFNFINSLGPKNYLACGPYNVRTGTGSTILFFLLKILYLQF